MESSTFLSSVCGINKLPPARRFLGSPWISRRRHDGRRCFREVFIVNANSRDYKGRLVDENMIVLRMRIKEAKMLESAGQEPPANWMEWEKKYFGHYNQDVCEIIGLLQLFLMNTRPSLAIGMLALVVLSVPISSYIVMHNVMDMVRKLLF